MPLSQSKLADELKAMVPAATEPPAILALVTAYGNYAADAMGAGIPITPAGVSLGKNAMTGALTGMSAPGMGITAIPNSLIAFWGAVCSAAAVSFPGTITGSPPPQATLIAGFAALMPVNTAAGLSLDDSAAAIAVLWHINAITGGTVTLIGPPPVPGPIL